MPSFHTAFRGQHARQFDYVSRKMWRQGITMPELRGDYE